MAKGKYVAQWVKADGTQVEVTRFAYCRAEVQEWWLASWGHPEEFMTLRVIRVVECCGANLECTEFTNCCPDCGADYNSAGVRLAPRERWGEETGEHWLDCY